MLIKLATHVVVFGLGAAAGIYWGVNHPQQAQMIHDTEQQDGAKIKAAFAQGQQQVLQKVVNDQSAAANSGAPAAATHVDEYKKMLQTAQQDFNDAKAKVGN